MCTCWGEQFVVCAVCSVCTVQCAVCAVRSVQLFEVVCSYCVQCGVQCASGVQCAVIGSNWQDHPLASALLTHSASLILTAE